MGERTRQRHFRCMPRTGLSDVESACLSITSKSGSMARMGVKLSLSSLFGTPVKPICQILRKHLHLGLQKYWFSLFLFYLYPACLLCFLSLFFFRLLYKQNSWNVRLKCFFAIKVESLLLISYEILTNSRNKVRRNERISLRAHVYLWASPWLKLIEQINRKRKHWAHIKMRI